MKTALPAALTSFIPWKQLTALTSSWNMELLTIASMAVVVIIMWIQSFGWGEHGLDIEEKFWLLKGLPDMGEYGQDIENAHQKYYWEGINIL